MIRRPSMRRWLISTTALAGVLALGIPAALANPEGGVVTQGAATITQPDAKTVQVNQTSNRAVIDWRSFSIAADELTRFNQPSSSAIALNRVTGDQVSQILGRLQANGQVVLVNPNGIVFGAGSKIDVGALIASTANIKTENFMAGNMKFDIPGKPNAQIINQGAITAADGGLVALVSPHLHNSGIIVARLGKVGLVGTNGATIDLYGDNLILFQTSDKITSQLVGLDGKPVSALIENDGKIYADGGRVLLTANVAKGVVDNAINTTGLISARAVEQQGGEIVLKGEDAGIVQVSGSLDASGKDAGQKGGTVNVLGEKVGLVGNASVDVSGDAGGGTALIGGDYQGKGTVRNAQVAYMGQDATINASALRIGNGGRAILWSDGTTRSYGRIFAQGGVNGGDGGFVETSGKGFLDQTGTVNTLAFKGKTGTWLLDPMDIFVANNGGHTLNSTNSSLFADNSGGTSTIDPSVINSATSNVTLQASRDAYVINAINMTDAGKALIIEAGRDLRVNANINTNDGDIFLLGGYDSASGQGGVNPGATIINGASVYSGAGNITITGRGTSSALTWNNEQHGIVVVNSGTVSTTSGNITMRGTGGTGSGSSGVIVGDQGSKVTSTDGDVDIVGVSGTCPGCYVGQGGVQVGGSGSEGHGIAGGLIGVTGSGGLRIQGTGYNATWSSGVSVVDAGVISHTGTPTSGKKFEIIGSSATGDHSSWAVRVANSGYILTKDADLTIWGTAGNAAWLDSVGISVADYGANGMPHITSTGQGGITLIGAPGASAGNLRAGISIGQDTWTNWNYGGRQAYIQSYGAPVTFQTDSLAVRSVLTFGPHVVGPGGVNTNTPGTITNTAYGTPASPSTARTVPTPPAPGSGGNPFAGLDASGLYAAILNASLTASYSANANWTALKTSNGGNATAAQITADAMLNSYNRYKNLSGQALANKLFQDVISNYTFDSGNGIYHMVNSSSNALWKGSYGSTLSAGSAQIVANAMINTYAAYRNASAQELANGLRSGAFSSNPGDLIWQALAVNPNRAQALQLVSGASTSGSVLNGQTGGAGTSTGAPNSGAGTTVQRPRTDSEVINIFLNQVQIANSINSAIFEGKTAQEKSAYIFQAISEGKASDQDATGRLFNKLEDMQQYMSAIKDTSEIANADKLERAVRSSLETLRSQIIRQGAIALKVANDSIDAKPEGMSIYDWRAQFAGSSINNMKKISEIENMLESGINNAEKFGKLLDVAGILISAKDTYSAVSEGKGWEAVSNSLQIVDGSISLAATSSVVIAATSGTALTVAISAPVAVGAAIGRVVDFGLSKFIYEPSSSFVDSASSAVDKINQIDRESFKLAQYIAASQMNGQQKSEALIDLNNKKMGRILEIQSQVQSQYGYSSAIFDQAADILGGDPPSMTALNAVNTAVDMARETTQIFRDRIQNS